jgi:hypothetical protein
MTVKLIPDILSMSLRFDREIITNYVLSTEYYLVVLSAYVNFSEQGKLRKVS